MTLSLLDNIVIHW